MREIVAVLYNIRSFHNVGSVFRTADALGVGKIYLAGFTPEPIDRFGRFRSQLTKVSLGAERSVPWDGSTRSPRAIDRLLENLRQAGYKIFAVEQSILRLRSGLTLSLSKCQKNQFRIIE